MTQTTSPPTTPPSTDDGGRSELWQAVAKGAPILGAIVVLVVVGAVTTDGFASASNMRAVISSASLVGTVAVAMTFLTMSGNFVSLGTQQAAAAGSCTFLYLVSQGSGVLLAVVSTLALLVVLGIVQGLLVSLGLNAIITTLAAGVIVYGAFASLTGGRAITAAGHSTGFLSSSLVLGIPLPVYGFVVVTALCTWLAQKSAYGRRVLLTGASRPAAVLNGIRPSSVTIASFVVLSLGVGVAGILYGAQLGQASANDFGSLTFDAIAAVLVGGTAIGGGAGSPLRSACGALIIALLKNVMVLNDFDTGWRLTIQGVLVVGVVCALRAIERRGKR